jgi:UDPglucose 6-dehydrogenase
MRISVIGCGYLGTTHAAAMAELGHEVLGVEADPAKRDALTRGEITFYEPRLEDLLAQHVRSGRLRFTDSYADAGDFGDLHFLCVGTPQQPESMAADVSQVDTAIADLAPFLTRPTLVVGKSTVPVGTAARVAALLARLAPAGDLAMLAWNPEFLREGHAVDDSMRPNRLVFGVTDPAAEKLLRDFYATVIDSGVPVVSTDFATAELVKVAANGFLATKVSYINAMAEVCEATGADVVDLADSLGYDERIGRQFLQAGIGFGGGCLPKDIRAFVHRAGELGVGSAMSFLAQVDEINLHQRARVVQIASSMIGDRVAGARVAVWGAAFKPESDDVRDSPALWVAGQLQLRGASVRVFDPRATHTARVMFPTLTYAESAIEACRDADLVLHLTEWREFREITPADLAGVVSRPRIFDGRNVLDLQAWRAAGWTARALGRP